ncbi:ribosome small subunit-dependent GTPase A [Peredibacter sp. HCB2-198]|uniref:ribosome small subunit-dependent GTPase A n=1 Tax=Peredibacter sp. HCB2-198 TaxID=3383025 RepID=UPI0038B46F4C
MIIKARIFRSSKRHFDCQREDTKEVVHATALATLLKEDHIVVGDWVEISPPPQGGEEWKIENVIERQSAIFRNLPREQKKKVIAANVDVMMVVVSAGKPAYKRGLVDRYLARSDYWNVPAYVIFNKMDLYEETEFDIKFEADRLKWLNVKCFEVSANDKNYKPRYLSAGFEELSQELHKKTAILVGHSGVGKSRLITELSHGKVELLSGELGKVGKGAHTTTWAELIDADDFTLIDSPGIRSMSLADLTKQDLLYCFSDVNEWTTKCQFSSNCTHEANSKGCFFQKLDGGNREDQLILSRLDSYKRVLEEVSNIPDWLKKP